MNSILTSTVFLSLIIFGLSSSKPNSNKAFDKFLKKSSYVLIPSGNAFINKEEKSVQSFYMSKGEVTNFQYKEFLSYLKSNNEIEKLKICQIDTANWSTNSPLCEPMSKHYHSHPAYSHYPVVNVSHEAAQLYCEFVSKALSKNFPGVKVEVRLPSYTEYVRAARGDSKIMPYGWNSISVRNDRGQVLGNFLKIGEEFITKNSETGKLEIALNETRVEGSKTHDILAPSESYWANQFGVFNLSGNAAEMIDEKGIAVGGSWKSPGHDVRIESKNKYANSDPSVGFRVVFTYVSEEN